VKGDLRGADHGTTLSGSKSLPPANSQSTYTQAVTATPLTGAPRMNGSIETQLRLGDRETGVCLSRWSGLDTPAIGPWGSRSRRSEGAPEPRGLMDPEPLPTPPGKRPVRREPAPRRIRETGCFGVRRRPANACPETPPTPARQMQADRSCERRSLSALSALTRLADDGRGEARPRWPCSVDTKTSRPADRWRTPEARTGVGSVLDAPCSPARCLPSVSRRRHRDDRENQGRDVDKGSTRTSNISAGRLVVRDTGQPIPRGGGNEELGVLSSEPSG
jgi:hypothetical protein